MVQKEQNEEVYCVCMKVCLPNFGNRHVHGHGVVAINVRLC